MASPETLAIFVGGGPARGIGSVISAATIRFAGGLRLGTPRANPTSDDFRRRFAHLVEHEPPTVFLTPGP